MEAEKEKMKIILSRKGFDSASGGVPSPIFPDGTMMSLPIPDKLSLIAYKDVAGNRWLSMGEAVSQLAGIPDTHRAHLDPDLVPESLPREKGWRPIFGQCDAAEGHLRRQGVGKGDIFLFFGLFRKVEKAGSGWRYVRNSNPVHSLFGWLQIADRVPVSAWPTSDRWALYHPHFAREPHQSNVIYTATEQLTLASSNFKGVAGAGTFKRFAPILCLTAPHSKHPSRWLLPKWCFPDGRESALSYHRDPARWEKTDGGTFLSSVSRGQEFVLDCDHYPEAVEAVKKLVSTA